MSPRSVTNAALDQRLIQGLLPRLRMFWGVAPASLGPLFKHCWVLSAPRTFRSNATVALPRSAFMGPAAT